MGCPKKHRSTEKYHSADCCHVHGDPSSTRASTLQSSWSSEPCQKVAGKNYGKFWEDCCWCCMKKEHALHGVGKEGQCKWLELREKVAPLYLKMENGKLYQFQEVDVNATKFGQDYIKKSVGPTGKWYHSPVFIHSNWCNVNSCPIFSLLAEEDMHAVSRLQRQ